jgi:hypothetical protein
MYVMHNTDRIQCTAVATPFGVAAVAAPQCTAVATPFGVAAVAAPVRPTECRESGFVSDSV